MALPIHQQRQEATLLHEFDLDIRYSALHVGNIAAQRPEVLEDQVLDVSHHAVNLGGEPSAGKRGGVTRCTNERMSRSAKSRLPLEGRP
jgi:hypothetical protein